MREHGKERGIRGAAGVSTVEFGLILPILLIILLGTIDYGWVFFVRLNMINAAREGARVGVTKGDEDTGLSTIDEQKVKDVATQYLQTAGLTDSIAVQVDLPTPHDTTDDSVKVTITNSPFRPLVGFVPVPPGMEVTAEMRWELAPPEPSP